MGKKRNLNGLPNSLEQRYFSTLFYWGKGYMADWIWNAATEKGITDIEIDILAEFVFPKELEIEPLVAYLSPLRETITTTLKSNNFPEDFIIDARFKIYISQKYNSLRLMTCQPTITDKDGRVYVGKTYTEKAYETPFKVFPVTLVEKIKRVIGK